MVLTAIQQSIVTMFKCEPCVYFQLGTILKFPTKYPLDTSIKRNLSTHGETVIFFVRLSQRFQDVQAELSSYIDVRQFTAACELVCKGVGVSVVSELDAEKYSKQGLEYRPFVPALPHGLSLVRPIHKKPSLITLEFMECFRRSLKPYVVA